MSQNRRVPEHADPIPAGIITPEQVRSKPIRVRQHEGLDEIVRRSVVLAKLQDLLAWGRKNSIWPFNFGLSCC